MRFDIITLFPELFAPLLTSGITRRAYEGGLVDVRLWNPRDHAEAIAAALGIVRAELPHVRLAFTHSQAANKPADPGELVARIVTAAGAAMLPPLTPIPGYHVGAGQPWPHPWRLPLDHDQSDLSPGTA